MGCPKGQPFISMELLSLRSAYRASVCASTAINALVSVDNVDSITLSDSFAGALISACTACYAIFRNLVCHFHVPPINLIDILYHIFLDLKRPFSKIFIYFSKRFSKTEKYVTVSFLFLLQYFFSMNKKEFPHYLGDMILEHPPRCQV